MFGRTGRDDAGHHRKQVLQPERVERGNSRAAQFASGCQPCHRPPCGCQPIAQQPTPALESSNSWPRGFQRLLSSLQARSSSPATNGGARQAPAMPFPSPPLLLRTETLGRGTPKTCAKELPAGVFRRWRGLATGTEPGFIPSTARSIMIMTAGQFSYFPGADGRLPIRPRCGRVCELASLRLAARRPPRWIVDGGAKEGALILMLLEAN